MKKAFQSLVLALVSAGLIGCTSLRTVTDSRTATAAAAASGADHDGLEVGDTVIVDTREGQSMTLDITSLDANGLVGKNSETHQESKVPWSDVEKLQRREFDGFKTTVLVVAIVAGLVAWIQAAVSSMFSG